VRIAFYHYTENDTSVSSGWYVDNIEVIKKVPEWNGDFECGWNDWSASNGVWEVGAPTGGPEVCHSGSQCAGTILNGNYPTWTNSRLVGPTILLPSGEETLLLSFQHWYLYEGGDYGKTQISFYDEMTGWSDWDDLTGNITGNSNGWTKHPDISLADYSGKKVRIGFWHETDNDSGTNWG